LHWTDGTTMTFDDGNGEKDFETRLNNAGGIATMA
jgi:hypothetical protein